MNEKVKNNETKTEPRIVTIDIDEFEERLGYKICESDDSDWSVEFMFEDAPPADDGTIYKTLSSPGVERIISAAVGLLDDYHYDQTFNELFTRPPTPEAEGAVMNVVNQLMSAVHDRLPLELKTPFVKFRQENNDDWDTFVEGFFIDKQNQISQLQSELDRLREGGWIPELPKENGKYEVTVQGLEGDKTVNVEWFYIGTGWENKRKYHVSGHTIIAHRPLPAPYSPETANTKEKNDGESSRVL